jgi:hypothetical protein
MTTKRSCAVTDLWKIERRLWLEGAEAYEEVMATLCIMVFGPSGIMQRDDILESLRNAPRWSDVELSERSESFRDEVAILAYRAVGEREDDAPYKALCTSTYVREGNEWRLAQHQQTPV